MKLFVHKLFVPLLAGLILTGCASSYDDPLLSDNPDSPVMSGSSFQSASATGSQNPVLADVAHFHVGETVSILFSGAPDQLLPHEEQIKEDGTITLPYIGTIRAVGKTAGELQNEIHDLYVPKYYVRLTVTVKPGDLIYYVRGEVKAPGRQLYIGEATVTKAITSAGDFTDFANHSNVQLIRANGQQIKVNVDKVLSGKAPDPLVYPGDQVLVKRSIW